MGVSVPLPTTAIGHFNVDAICGGEAPTAKSDRTSCTLFPAIF